MVIGQGWIALKPEYCIRARQLVRSQNRLSYERGWMRRGGGQSGRDWNGKQGARVRGSRGGGGGDRKVMARNSSPGRCGAEGIIHTVPLLSPLPHLSERVHVREGCVDPLRGQRKMLRLHSSSLCEGLNAACRQLASHWSLISTDREEEHFLSLSHKKKKKKSHIYTSTLLFPRHRSLLFLRLFLLFISSPSNLSSPTHPLWYCIIFKVKTDHRAAKQEVECGNALSAKSCLWLYPCT